jgi:predicted nucleotidyltransferase
MAIALTTHERDALQEAKTEVASRFPLAWIKLFGSKARGNADPESDIDVLFVLDTLNWEAERSVFEICFHASLRHDILLAPLVMSRAETESPLTQATPFFQNVEKEGVLL